MYFDRRGLRCVGCRVSPHVRRHPPATDRDRRVIADARAAHGWFALPGERRTCFRILDHPPADEESPPPGHLRSLSPNWRDAMTMRRCLGLVLGVLSVGVVAPASASALILGDLATTDPGPCTLATSTAWAQQYASSTASYVAPVPGVITSWSTSFGPPGAPVELVVSSAFNAAAHPSAVVLGVDSENLPNPLSADNVSTFTLRHPIAVQPGDLIGLYTQAARTRGACSAGRRATTSSVGPTRRSPAERSMRCFQARVASSTSA
jgi:hypothetical protein